VEATLNFLSCFSITQKRCFSQSALTAFFRIPSFIPDFGSGCWVFSAYLFETAQQLRRGNGESSEEGRLNVIVRLAGSFISFRMGPNTMTNFTGRDLAISSHARGAKMYI